MHMTFGLLKVTLKNTYRRGNTIMYQRAVPAKLAGRYSGKTVKHDLKTSDLTIAEKAVALLNRRYEAEWAGLLAAPESSPASLKAHADAFLKDRGLRPGAPMGLSPADNHPMAVHLLHEEADGKRMRFAGGDDWLYRNAASEDYLTPIEIEAGKRLHGATPKTLNDALELHLEIHPQRDNTVFVQYQRRVFASLIAVTGDREIDTFKKADARAYLEAELPKVKTTTVRRRLGVLSAVFATYSFGDYGIVHPNFSMKSPATHANAKIRYTKGSHHHIFRARSLKKFSFTQYHALADRVVKSGHFVSSDYSFGDDYVWRCSQHEARTGNLGTWVEVDMNHHMVYVVDRLGHMVDLFVKGASTAAVLAEA